MAMGTMYKSSTAPYKRRRGRPRGKNVPKAVKAYVKKAIKSSGETKFHEVTNALAYADYNGEVVDISAIAQGTTDTTRVGDKCSPISLELAYWVNGETYSSIARVIVFRWLPDSTGGTPSLANVLQHYAATYCVLSPYVHDRRSLFNVLYDGFHTVSNNGGSEIVRIKKTIKLSGTIDFNAGNTTREKGIYVVFMTDRVIGSSASQYMHSRLNYKDS